MRESRDSVVLCVDDDPGIRELYQAMFSRNGYEAIAVSDAYQALRVYQFAGNVDIAVVDLEMPGMNGYELAERLKTLNPSLPIVMVSSSDPEMEEMSPFVDAAIRKGVPIRNILDRIELLLAESADPPVEIRLPC
jgi:CheY-like chemotaxis protein